MVKNVKIYLKISNFYYLEIKKKFPAEEKEDDEMMAGFVQAAQPQQRNKPKDIRSKFMVTDISFHPFEERIAMSNIEGEIFM